jgi:hypothetical protein
MEDFIATKQDHGSYKLTLYYPGNATDLQKHTSFCNQNIEFMTFKLHFNCLSLIIQCSGDTRDRSHLPTRIEKWPRSKVE